MSALSRRLVIAGLANFNHAIESIGLATFLPNSSWRGVTRPSSASAWRRSAQFVMAGRDPAIQSINA